MKRLGLGLAIVLAMTCCAWAQYCAEDDMACTEHWYLLEETLFAYEQVVGKALGPEAAQCLAADSSRWHAAQAQTCLGDSCRNAAYAERMSSLLTFLPEAEPVGGLDFVTTPQLVAVLAPEAEAAKVDDFAPLDSGIFGLLSHASADAEHMGLAISDESGTHVIVQDMDIGNQAGHGVIQALLADEPDGRFLVRGALDDVGNFSAGQCRLVYRMPIPDN
jgi:hypothetical protein